MGPEVAARIGRAGAAVLALPVPGLSCVGFLAFAGACTAAGAAAGGAVTDDAIAGRKGANKIGQELMRTENWGRRSQLVWRWGRT